MRGAVHHVDLTVRDPAASRPFYEAVLGFLGYRLIAAHDRGYDFDLGEGSELCSIGVVRAEGANAGRPHDRYSPGLHHFAWRAETREDVDRFHDMLKEVGAEILDPPADYPQYNAGRGYYEMHPTSAVVAPVP